MLNTQWYLDPLYATTSKQKTRGPLLGNGPYTAIEERYFLCNPCRDVIIRTISEE
jgi:hypothetical protein